jgi:hypothetical protein
VLDRTADYLADADGALEVLETAGSLVGGCGVIVS